MAIERPSEAFKTCNRSETIKKGEKSQNSMGNTSLQVQTIACMWQQKGEA